MELKLRPLKASSIPPRVDCGCVGAACIPPKDGWRSCCGGGCGLGPEAYNDKIDCLRSGREGTADPVGVDAELDGLPVDEAGGAPKNSRPSNESAAFVCFGGAEVLGGGGRETGISVVLGLAGGSIMSPNKSIGSGPLGAEGTGWLEVDAARSDDTRSSFAFS